MNRAEIFFWNLIAYLVLILMGEGAFWLWGSTGLMIYFILVGLAICWPHVDTLEEQAE